MYIKNNRLYDNGVSFEIPENVRMNISPDGSVSFFRDDETWYIHVDVWGGQFGDKELKEYIADLFENNNISALRTDERMVNNVPMRQVSYEFADYPVEPACSLFLNAHVEHEKFWSYCQVWCTAYYLDPASGKKIEDHPVISTFINSVRKEPLENWREIPLCVIEMREKDKNLCELDIRKYLKEE